MSLKGQFHLIRSQVSRENEWSFSLTNTNSFFSENFDCVLIDSFNQNPLFLPGQTLRAGATMAFNRDTVRDFSNFKGWFQGDRFAIVNKKNQILQQWQLNVPVPCPECHGTNKCSQCGGQGYFLPKNSAHLVSCQRCLGTGRCITCDIPVRRTPLAGWQMASSNSPVYSNNQNSGIGSSNKNAQIRMIQDQIEHVRNNLKEVELLLLGNNLNPNSSVLTSSSYINQKYQYEKMLIELQGKLNRLLME